MRMSRGCKIACKIGIAFVLYNHTRLMLRCNCNNIHCRKLVSNFF